jgi:hypothetical protein
VRSLSDRRRRSPTAVSSPKGFVGMLCQNSRMYR